MDPTAPSRSPPLSEPAPSSSRSSGAARPRKKRKTYKDPSRVTDAKLKETIDEYEQREDLLNKITTFKRKSGLSAAKAIQHFSDEAQGFQINRRLINDRIAKGFIGASPPKPGPVSKAPSEAVEAAAELMSIKDLTGQPQDLTETAEALQATLVAGGVELSAKQLQTLIRRQIVKAGELSGQGWRRVEAARWQWTTFTNLDEWLDAIFHFCVERGYATIEPQTVHDPFDGKTYDCPLSFAASNLRRIVNMDETAITTGATKTKGGRSRRKFTNKKRPGAIPVSKDIGYAFTGCFATTPAGEFLPPWIIFKSDAEDASAGELPIQLSIGMPKGRGQFGTDAFQEWSAHLTCNKTAGVGDDMFLKYIMELIMKVYPDAADEPGKRVLLIVDNGPGRLSRPTFDFCRGNGIDLFPKCPNTSSCTQEMDLLFEEFKKKCAEVKASMCSQLASSTFKARLCRYHVARILSGCKSLGPPNASEAEMFLEEAHVNPCGHAFSTDRIIHAWISVGAVPFTKKVLQSIKVRHENRDGDPEAVRMAEKSRKHANKLLELAKKGFRTSPLKASVPKMPPRGQKLSREEQHTFEKVKDMVKEGKVSMKISKLIQAFGTNSLTGETMQHVWRAKAEIDEEKTAKKEKQAQEKAATIHAAAETVRARGKNVDCLTLDELRVLLRELGIPPKGDKATLLAEYKKHAPAQQQQQTVCSQ